MVILLGIERASETGILCVGEATADCSADGPAAFLKRLPAVALDHVGHGVGFAGGIVVARECFDQIVSLAE